MNHEVRQNAKKELIKHASACLADIPLSIFEGDWPKCMPKSAIRKIERQSEQLRLMAIALRTLSDKL
jgi:hypothetical protein